MIQKCLNRSFSLILACFILTACFQSRGNEIFAEEYPIEFNKRLTLRTNDNCLDFRRNDAIVLWIENDSENCVIFPYHYNFRILYFDQKSWITVPNEATILGSKKDITLEASDQPYNAGILGALPDFSQLNISYPVKLRMMVSGLICDEKKMPTDTSAGAYIDITIR